MQIDLDEPFIEPPSTRLTLIKTPSTTLTDGHVCKIVTGFNPVVFQIARADELIDSLQSETIAGVDYVRVNFVDPSIYSYSGINKVYIAAYEGQDIVISGIFDLLLVDPNRPHEYIVINLEWNAAYLDIDGGAVNRESGEKIELQVNAKAKDTQEYIVAPRAYSFDRFSITKVFANALVRDYFAQKLDVVNRYCVGQSLQFAADFTLDDETLQVDFDDDYVIVKAVAQLGQSQFMKDYAIYDFDGRISNDKKFLTAMKKPVKFKGYPFHLYALIDDVSDAGSTTLVTALGSTSQIFDKKGVWQVTILDNANYAKLRSSEDLTETLTIEQATKCDGVYLRWENDYAGYDYYLFSGNVIENVRGSTGQTYQKYIEDVETETENIKVLSKDFSNSLRCFANFDKDNAESFKQLVRSRFVEMYVNESWITVDVQLNSYTIENYKPIGKISLTVNLPETYVK